MREHLLQLIDLASIKDLIDSCVWVVKDNKVKIDTVSPYQDVVIKLKGDLNCKNGKIGIYSNSQLRSVIGMMDDSFMFLPEPKEQNILISDDSYDVRMRTADIDTIPEAPKVNIPPTPTISINLTDGEFASKCLTSFKSLKDTDVIYFSTRDGMFGGHELHITVGDESRYENTIEIKHKGHAEQMNDTIPFNIDILSKILGMSKDFAGTLDVYQEGIMHIKLENEKISVEYFVVRRS